MAISPTAGRYVSFTTDLVLEEADEPALFELRETGDGVALEVVGLGTCVSADPDSGRVYASGLEVGPRETFVLDPVGDGMAALRVASSDRTAAGEGAFGLGTPFRLEEREVPEIQPSACCCGPGAHGGAANWDLETHAQIVDKALELLRGLSLPDVRVFTERLARDTGFWGPMHKGLRDADELDRYTRPVIEFFGNKQPAWGSHFYDPDTRENYLHGLLNFPGNITAQTEGQRWFDVSVHFARRELQHRIDPPPGNIAWDAGYHLGLSLHFLTDVMQPMHAANFANCFGEDRSGHFNYSDRRHSNFELWAEEQVRKGYLDDLPALSPGEVAEWGDGTTAGEFLHGLAVEAKGVWTSELRAIARSQGLDPDWSRARGALDRSLKIAPRRVARFLRNWFLTVQRRAPFDSRRWYRVEEPTKEENVCRVTQAGKTWWRRWNLTDDSAKLYFLPNAGVDAGGTTGLACRAAKEDLWTLYDEAGISWLGMGSDRESVDARFRVMQEDVQHVRFYETRKDEAMMVETKWPWDGYICRWDPAWPNQRFILHDAGPIEREDFDAIESRWPGWRWITWAGVDRRTAVHRAGWVTRYFASAGETLDSIADRFGVDTATMRQANPEVKAGEVAGELVNLPYPTVEARQGETLVEVAARVGGDAGRMLVANPGIPYLEEPLGAGQRVSLPHLYYVARDGDTFAGIGAPFVASAAALRSANPGTPDPPPPGKRLYIPTRFAFEMLVAADPHA